VTSFLRREQTEVGLELGIIDGMELILGTEVGMALGITDGEEVGSNDGCSTKGGTGK